MICAVFRIQVAFGGNGDDGDGYWSGSIREVHVRFGKIEVCLVLVAGGRLRRVYGRQGAAGEVPAGKRGMRL